VCLFIGQTDSTVRFSEIVELLHHQRDALHHQRDVLTRQQIALNFISKEVVTQHRLRMDVWTPSKRTRVEQQDFKNSLVSYYKCSHPNNANLLKCMVLNRFYDRPMVIASHIWKYCTHGDGLPEFGLHERDINSNRNGMLLCKDIEKAFDLKRICFLVHRLHQEDLYVRVLDPSLSDPATSPIINGTGVLFSDIDGAKLDHPPGNYPFRRILDFHAKLSFDSAIRRQWIAPDAAYESFFDMSIDASIPDLNIMDIFMEE